MENILKVFEYRRKLKDLRDKGNKIFTQAGEAGRGLTNEDKRSIEEIDKQIDAVEAEMDVFIKINRIPEEQLRSMDPIRPEPGNSYSDRTQSRIVLSEDDRSFLRFCRSGASSLDRTERRALVEDTTGQYIISPAIESELQRSVANLVVIRQLASKRVLTNTDRIRVRDIGEAAVGWGKLETGSVITESTPTPSEATKYVEDLYGLVKIGEDELMDSDYDLAVFLADTFARAIADAEQEAFLKGTGHANGEPDGITVDTTLVAATKTTAAANAVEINDFMQMLYAVPAKIRKGSSWIVNSLTELEIRKLRWSPDGVNFTGGYLWQPSLSEGVPPTFLGYPIYNVDIMDTLSDTAGIIAIFGNFMEGYRILDRMGTTIQRLDELYSEAGLIGFKVHARVGGYLIRPSNSALVLLKEAAE